MTTKLESFIVRQEANRNKFKPYIINANIQIVYCTQDLTYAESMKMYNNRTDEIETYQIRHALEISVFERKAGHVYIVSFQEHTDGKRFAVFKPYTTKKENLLRLKAKEQQHEST